MENSEIQELLDSARAMYSDLRNVQSKGLGDYVTKKSSGEDVICFLTNSFGEILIAKMCINKDERGYNTDATTTLVCLPRDEFEKYKSLAELQGVKVYIRNTTFNNTHGSSIPTNAYEGYTLGEQGSICKMPDKPEEIESQLKENLRVLTTGKGVNMDVDEPCM